MNQKTKGKQLIPRDLDDGLILRNMRSETKRRSLIHSSLDWELNIPRIRSSMIG